eukprot:TRINITY_DN2367_c0_g4_i3.p1 TRINITY_DN2367_c0_g4~~TRINITY_DN2367_c0_g4_i3.p1  ORF type:complete len:202 (-),score=59.79 TRINITY_DN2367_c0_g4_i3:172-756(-)
MIRRPPRSTHCISSAASDVYKRQVYKSAVKRYKKGCLGIASTEVSTKRSALCREKARNEFVDNELDEETNYSEETKVTTSIVKKPYEKIIAEQELFGYWKWNKATFDAINANEKKAKENIPIELEGIISEEESLLTAWVTIIVLAKLELDCAESVQSWQLIFKKSLSWLGKSGVDYEKFKEFANKIINCKFSAY